MSLRSANENRINFQRKKNFFLVVTFFLFILKPIFNTFNARNIFCFLFRFIIFYLLNCHQVFHFPRIRYIKRYFFIITSFDLAKKKQQTFISTTDAKRNKMWETKMEKKIHHHLFYHRVRYDFWMLCIRLCLVCAFPVEFPVHLWDTRPILQHFLLCFFFIRKISCCNTCSPSTLSLTYSFVHLHILHASGDCSNSGRLEIKISQP